MRSQPKRGSRGSRSGSGRPGGGRDAREPTEYLRSGGPPAPERLAPAAAPEPWRPPPPPPAPSLAPVAPATPPIATPSPRPSSSETIISTQSADSGELVAALVGVSGVL